MAIYRVHGFFGPREFETEDEANAYLRSQARGNAGFYVVTIVAALVLGVFLCWSLR